MGFGIQVSSDVRQMLSDLSLKPHQVFQKPYAAYMLFLFEEVDEHAWSWFGRHAKSLDSLTGPDVAFAVFSHRTRFRIEVPHGGEQRRPEQKTLLLGDEALHETYSVDRLIKSGRCGWVADGDEIAAVNEAVHAIARETGLTQHLPCVMVVDGLPHPACPRIWLPLTAEALPGLYARIRAAIGRLQVHPHYERYQDGLGQICQLGRMVEEVEGNLASIEDRISGLETRLRLRVS